MSKTPGRFVLDALIPAPREEVWNTWTSSEGHGAMTGAPAEHTAETGAFSAWGGYIWGETLHVDDARRLVQSWRTVDFADDEADSRVTIEFESADGGTRVRITHENLPPHGGQYQQGWVDHYFDPMKAHFGH